MVKSIIYEIMKSNINIIKNSRMMKGQGSIEYIMVLSAVSIIIVIALAMVMQLKGVAMHSFAGNGTSQSISSELSNELLNISK
ncbi:MAG: hypothetical protein ACP5RI_00250 [Candidatus Micrarchaeia archaeon]